MNQHCVAFLFLSSNHSSCHFTPQFHTDDVGVMQTDKGKSSDVSRFLNRLLGMNLNRQKMMTEYFLKSLENKVVTAKRAGKYDVGIKTLTGNNIEVRFDNT